MSTERSPSAASRASRSRDELRGSRVRLRGADRRPPDAVTEPGGGRGEPRVDADQGAAIGLVGAVRRGVGRGLRQRRERRRHRDGGRGQAQLGAERVRLVEVVLEHDRRLPARRLAQGRRGDEGIAVAIAADPAADAEQRRQCRAGRHGVADAVLAQQVLEPRLHRRRLAQERPAVVVERVLDLVRDGDARGAHQPRLPDGQHRAPQRLLVAATLVRGQRQAIALGEQRARSRAGGRGCSCAAPRSGARSGPARRARAGAGRAPLPAAAPRPGSCARASSRLPSRGGPPSCWRRRSSRFWCRSSAMFESWAKSVNACTATRLLASSSVAEHGLELEAGLALLLAAEAQRGAPDALHQVENGLARLLAHDLAEKSAEQTDVLAQRVGCFRRTHAGPAVARSVPARSRRGVAADPARGASETPPGPRRGTPPGSRRGRRRAARSAR